MIPVILLLRGEEVGNRENEKENVKIDSVTIREIVQQTKATGDNENSRHIHSLQKPN